MIAIRKVLPEELIIEIQKMSMEKQFKGSEGSEGQAPRPTNRNEDLPKNYSMDIPKTSLNPFLPFLVTLSALVVACRSTQPFSSVNIKMEFPRAPAK